ncbi:MAG: long-chain acyl-CoA synthetase [Blastocatellia bacterium]|jgi:long-chain acyl-CoA synthetase|nr:long-chain acyl-CoA synthetase [Blastocatellia bacterium]
MKTTASPLAEQVFISRPPRVPLYANEPATLAEMFEHAAREHPKPDTLNYKRDGAWRAISSDEMLRRARSIALGLHSLGIRRGDRVALLSDNCVEWTLSDAGCQFAGAVDVPIYSTLTPAQAAYILKDSGARALFIQGREKFEQLKSALAECAELEHVIFFEGRAVDAGDGLTLKQLEERGNSGGAAQANEELAQAVKPDDIATIIYTSGTTGEPKGVMLTHSNLVSNLIDCGEHFDYYKTDVALSVLPLSHVLERLAMYMYIHHGMRVFYAESIEKLGENFREVNPTIFIGVPRLFEKIYQRIKDKAAEGGRVKAGLLAWAVSTGKAHAQRSLAGRKVSPMLALKYRLASRLVFQKWRDALGGRIRFFIAGGAALPEEIGYVFAGAGMQIVQGYGLTETSPVISGCTLQENAVGTVGRPIRNVEVRIADDGEIETRGPNVMLGYFNKPAATREVFTEDGWFKTGDIGRIDEQGFLRITDRKKELFKTSGGKYIAPQPIEQMIKGSRFVNQVVLIGAGRKFPAALIVPDWEQIRSYAALKGIDASAPAELCKHPRIVDLFERQIATHTTELAKYERVKRIALLEHEFTIDGGELTPTLKVKRRVVDEKYREVIDQLYEEA